MDKLKKLYENYLNELLYDSRKKLEALPDWKLNSYLSSISLKDKSKSEKIELIQKKFLLNDTVYSSLIEDLNQIKESNLRTTNLKMLSIDDRALEGTGYTEKEKVKIYSFISKVLDLLKE